MMLVMFFFFNDTATTEIYTLSLHDALPISIGGSGADKVTSCRIPAILTESLSATIVAVWVASSPVADDRSGEFTVDQSEFVKSLECKT